MVERSPAGGTKSSKGIAGGGKGETRCESIGIATINTRPWLVL